MGRFAQADSIIPPGVQGLDSYAYASNSPIVYSDPSGHCPTCLIGAGVGAIVGAVAYGAYAVYSEHFNSWHLAAAAGIGEVAGALIGSGVGALAGAEAATGTAVAITGDGAAVLEATGGDPLVEVAAVSQAMQEAAPALEDAVTQVGDDTVNLFRAVSDGELNDVLGNQTFRPNPNGASMDAKWFWETVERVKGFSQQYSDLNNIIQVQAPKSILNSASVRLANLDGLGPAAAFIDEGLDVSNHAISSIKVLMK